MFIRSFETIIVLALMRSIKGDMRWRLMEKYQNTQNSRHSNSTLFQLQPNFNFEMRTRKATQPDDASDAEETEEVEEVVVAYTEVPYYTPSVPSTIKLAPSTLPGECIQRKLYYCSDSWTNLVHHDVDALLRGFSEVYQEQFVDAVYQGKKFKSPFEVFKSKYIELGWSNVHLLGVMDGPMRKDWCESVMKAFLREFDSVLVHV